MAAPVVSASRLANAVNRRVEDRVFMKAILGVREVSLLGLGRAFGM
jgi:hypothetical protein